MIKKKSYVNNGHNFFFNIGEVCDCMNWKKIDNNFLLPIYRYASYQKMSETDKV